MKKLPLTICGDLLRKKHMTIGNWKFYKVIFKSINKSFNSESLSKLKAIGSNVREIKFIDCYVNEPKVFQYILRNFLEVEKITFDKCTFRKRFKKSDTEVLELKNLNELVFKQQNLMVNYNYKIIIVIVNFKIFDIRC